MIDYNDCELMEKINDVYKKDNIINEKEKFINNLYPEYNSIFYHYKNFLSHHINKNTTLLDAGCGGISWINNSIHKDIYNKFYLNLVGIDLDFHALKENNIHSKKCRSNLENIPFKDQTFNLITCNFVLEHLEYPENVFKEFNRVLIKGGYLIMIFPNVYNPLMFFGKITPTWMHKMFLKKLINRYEKDVYPTYFKCNTVNSVEQLLKELKFDRVNVIKRGCFHVFMYSNFLLRFWIFFDKITNNKMLNFMKMNICIVYKKCNQKKVFI